jgi:16S rRNA (guanine527-N7)-methyltransferase
MFHVKHPWIEWAAGVGASLAEPQAAKLDAFEALLLERAVPMGMIARGDAGRLAERHILDSLRGVTSIPPDAEVVDLGSGAGLPGIPLSIAEPGARFVLAELRRNRAAFLELVRDQLGLQNVRVHPGDAGSIPSGSADVVVARAFKGAADGWDMAARLLRPHGAFLYWAGARFDPTDLPSDVRAIELPPPSQLADAGPVVIMTPQ